MRRGEFMPETARQWERLLAEEWGVSISMVRQHAAEASRRVRSGWRKPKAIRRDVLTKLQRAFWVADREGDAKGMTAAALATAKVAGVEAPTKVALTTAAGEDLPAYLHALATIAGGVEWFAGLQHVPSAAEVAAWVEAHRKAP